MLEKRKKLESLRKNGKEDSKTQEKYQNSRGKRMKIKLKYQGLRGTYVFLTTQIFNIFPIFFSISIPISISKFPKSSISISKSIFQKCKFQYQYQNQYFETVVFNIKININMSKILTFQNFSKFCAMSAWDRSCWA